MEENTVTLSLSEYNRLRDLEEATKKEFAVLKKTLVATGITSLYLTKEEYSKELDRIENEEHKKAEYISNNMMKS